MHKFRIENLTHPLNKSLVLDVCDNFLLQFKGLMFRPGLPDDQGLYFVGKSENRIDTSIHMFFMKFDITVLWLDSNLQVVDIQIAHRWPPFYFPRRPAKDFIEIHQSRFSEFHIGDQLAVENG